MSSDESERVLGVGSLIGMAQAMVAQSGNPDGFDAPRWVSAWLAQALPALGGVTPASYMDNFEGQKLVAELLAMSQRGLCMTMTLKRWSYDPRFFARFSILNTRFRATAGISRLRKRHPSRNLDVAPARSSRD